jgi:hypothetical protein
MSRFLLAAFAAALLMVSTAVGATNGPGAATGKTRVQGTVAAKFPQSKLIRVDSRSLAHIMRVPSSQARIRVGERVELRGSMLRQSGHGSRVLARGVVLTSSVPKSSVSSTSGKGEGRLEVRGTLSSLSPLTVTSSGGAGTTCSVPTGTTLTGFAVGDLVRMRCELNAGIWVLRALKQEDEDTVAQPDDDDDDTTDDATDDSDDDDSQDDDSDDDDSDDDDSSGPGGGGGGDDD